MSRFISEYIFMNYLISDRAQETENYIFIYDLSQNHPSKSNLLFEACCLFFKPFSFPGRLTNLSNLFAKFIASSLPLSQNYSIVFDLFITITRLLYNFP